MKHNELFETHDEELRTLERMAKYGGSFVKQLAALYVLGDSDNQQKLRISFKDYFIRYRDWEKSNSR